MSTFDAPDKVKLGSCKLIEEIMIGEDKLLRFSGVALGEACTIVVRGATQQILDEADRSLHDALCVLQQTVKETRTVLGGGEAHTKEYFGVERERKERREEGEGESSCVIISLSSLPPTHPFLLSRQLGYPCSFCLLVMVSLLVM